MAEITLVKGDTSALDRTWMSMPDGSTGQVAVHVVHDLPHLVVESLFGIEDGLWGVLAQGGFSAANRARTRTRSRRARLVTDVPLDELGTSNWGGHVVAKAVTNAVVNRWQDGPDTPDGVRARLTCWRSGCAGGAIPASRPTGTAAPSPYEGPRLPRGHGDGLDLDKLIRVAEHGHAEQGAGRVVRTEGRADDIPRRDQVGPLGRGDVHGGLEHVGQRGAGFGQGGGEIGHGQAGLRPDVTRADDDLRAAFRERAIPTPVHVTSDPQRLSDERRYEVPVTVIACEFSSAMLREWIAQDHPAVRELAKIRNVDYIDLPTGHWPQFTRPGELGQAILASVGPA